MAIYGHARRFGLSDTLLKRVIFSSLLVLCLGFAILASSSVAVANDQIEYQVKVAFIYNFIAFTQWPDNTAKTINLCVYGENHFGDAINKLQGRPVNSRRIKVEHINDSKKLKACQAIFFSKSIGNNLPNILKELQDKPVLTLANNMDAISQGVAINMSIANEKIVFEINLEAARRSGLDISSKLLQLAARVH